MLTSLLLWAFMDTSQIFPGQPCSTWEKGITASAVTPSSPAGARIASMNSNSFGISRQITRALQRGTEALPEFGSMGLFHHEDDVRPFDQFAVELAAHEKTRFI